MALVTITELTTGQENVDATEINQLVTPLLNEFNGAISNVNISASAAIAWTKISSTGQIANTDISSTAAIAGSKIDPDFGAQHIETTGNIIISGTANLGSTLHLSGAATFDSSLSVGTTLGVSGAVSLGSTLSVTGIASGIFQHPGTNVYTGTPAGVDTWYELDISAVVGSTTAFVIFKVSQAGDPGSAFSFNMRPHGGADDTGGMGSGSISTNLGYCSYALAMTDSAGKVDYRVITAASSMTIDVMGYIK